MSDYLWVDIGQPSDFDGLTKLIDSEYAPADVVADLKSSIRQEQFHWERRCAGSADA